MGGQPQMPIGDRFVNAVLRAPAPSTSALSVYEYVAGGRSGRSRWRRRATRLLVSRVVPPRCVDCRRDGRARCAGTRGSGPGRQNNPQRRKGGIRLLVISEALE